MLSLTQAALLRKIRFRTQSQTKVYFVMTQPELWSHQSIYDELEKDSNFEPQIVVMPDVQDTSRSQEESAKRSLRKFVTLGLRAKQGTGSDGKILSPRQLLERGSLLFFDQPNPRLGKKWRPHRLMMRSLLLYVPYGIKVSPDDRANFGLELHHFAWKIFAETTFHKGKFDEITRGPKSKTLLTGYPKLDFMPNFEASRTTRIRGIVSPHWSVRLPGWTYSTFEETGAKLLTLLDSYPEIHWILRPHQGLRSQVAESGLMTVEEIDSYFSRWDSATNGSLHHGSFYYDEFARSDFMITDCGSFLAEYVVTRKPLLHLSNPLSPGYNPFGEEVLSVNYSSVLGENIDWFVENIVLSGVDPLASRRAIMADRIAGRKEEKVGSAIVSGIKSGLLVPQHSRPRNSDKDP